MVNISIYVKSDRTFVDLSCYTHLQVMEQGKGFVLVGFSDLVEVEGDAVIDNRFVLAMYVGDNAEVLATSDLEGITLAISDGAKTYSIQESSPMNDETASELEVKNDNAKGHPVGVKVDHKMTKIVRVSLGPSNMGYSLPNEIMAVKGSYVENVEITEDGKVGIKVAKVKELTD